MPLTPAERRFLDAVSTDLSWSLVESFATMPRWQPEDVNRAADLIADRLRSVGVPHEVHTPEIYLSVPLSASVEADGISYRAKPPSSALSIPGGRTAPLVTLTANQKALRSYNRDLATLFGGTIRSAAEAREKIAGHIVVMSGFGNPALASLIEEWGGAGLIAVNPGVDVHWGTCTTVWGSPDLADLPRKPTIPVVAVNSRDGKALMALAGNGGQATIRTAMREGWFTQKVPVASIPGTDEPESFVLVHGHYDSWDVGVGDNATGDALLLELARVLWEHRSELRRSVKVAWWPGHSTGRYAGPTWFSDRFALELDRHCLAQINCDSPGCRWATSFHETGCMSECAALVTAAIRDVFPETDIGIERPHQAGDYSFNNIGLPSFFMLGSTMPEKLRAEKGYYAVSGCGANIAWHTENDTLEIADRAHLERDTKIYLLSLLRIANGSLLPFDWQATCQEFLATIERYEKASQGLADLAPARIATQALGSALQRLASSEAPLAKRNGALASLGRVLIPINFTREPRFRHDPAYTVPPLPTLAVAANLPTLPEPLRRSGAVELLRGQNRFVAAIEEATRIVARAL